jgi:hypothetical protein
LQVEDPARGLVDVGVVPHGRTVPMRTVDTGGCIRHFRHGPAGVSGERTRRVDGLREEVHGIHVTTRHGSLSSYTYTNTQ